MGKRTVIVVLSILLSAGLFMSGCTDGFSESRLSVKAENDALVIEYSATDGRPLEIVGEDGSRYAASAPTIVVKRIDGGMREPAGYLLVPVKR